MGWRENEISRKKLRIFSAFCPALSSRKQGKAAAGGKRRAIPNALCKKSLKKIAGILTEGMLFAIVVKSGKKVIKVVMSGKMKPRFRKSVHRSLDSKGRLVLPPEYRDIVCATSSSGSFVLTGYDNFLVAYTMPEWESFEEKIYQVQDPSPALSNFRRQIMGRAEELELDPQGRVRISHALMRLAGLSKDVLLVGGQGGTFEIWDTQRFDALKLDRAELPLVAKELAQSGIAFSL